MSREYETVWEPKERDPHQCWYKGVQSYQRWSTIGICNHCGKYWKTRWEYPFFDDKKWVRVRWFHLLSKWRIAHV